MAATRTLPAADRRDVEQLILNLPSDQARAVAGVLGLVAGQVEAERDAVKDDPSARYIGLATAHRIVGTAAAYARGVAGQ